MNPTRPTPSLPHVLSSHRSERARRSAHNGSSAEAEGKRRQQSMAKWKSARQSLTPHRKRCRNARGQPPACPVHRKISSGRNPCKRMKWSSISTQERSGTGWRGSKPFTSGNLPRRDISLLMVTAPLPEPRTTCLHACATEPESTILRLESDFFNRQM